MRLRNSIQLLYVHWFKCKQHCYDSAMALRCKQHFCTDIVPIHINVCVSSSYYSVILHSCHKNFLKKNLSDNFYIFCRKCLEKFSQLDFCILRLFCFRFATSRQAETWPTFFINCKTAFSAVIRNHNENVSDVRLFGVKFFCSILKISFGVKTEN